MAGKLWGIGVGPGDPELLTVKATKILAQVPVVFAPKARDEQPSLALTIAKEYLPSQVKVEEIVMPMTDDKLRLKKAWEEGAQSLWNYLKDGTEVAFLTLGDPSLYSTFIYLCQSLREISSTIPVEIIPGITSFSAAAAKAEIPLAEGDEPLVVLPGPWELAEEKALLSQANLVLMKVSRDYEGLLADLDNKGRLEKSTLIARVGQEGEAIVENLRTLSGKKVDYLSLIISK